MSRIATRFAALKAEGRGALIPYLQACDPDFDTSFELLRAMPGSGADLIEIGVPFSDPSADGPTIQAAAVRGLKGGSTMKRVLSMVEKFRTEDADTPIILMGYLNPIEQYGPEKFCNDAAQAGVDGLIIVDLPSEEADMIESPAQAAGLDIINLIAPTTSDTRLPHVLKQASGFVYYVSITGVTGTRTASVDELGIAIPRLRAVSDLPIAIGFGIRTPEQAAQAVKIADAAVVASALISTLEGTLVDGRATSETIPAVTQQLRSIADAVRTARATS